MDEPKNLTLILIPVVVFLIILLAIALTGCLANSSQVPSSGQNAQLPNNNVDNIPVKKDSLVNNSIERNNMTQDQIDQMHEQMQLLASSACKDKTENDSCEVQNPRDVMRGTCQFKEEKLLCVFLIENRTNGGIPPQDSEPGDLPLPPGMGR
jgi:hypothetical protein